jgi:N-acetylneuraminic acid mutarotase
MLSFGGNRGGVRLDDLKVLNTDNLKWSIPATKSLSPSPREGPALWTLREKVYCFGGEGEDGLHNDIWQLDTESWSWSQVPLRSRKNKTKHFQMIFQNASFH